jgi:5,8-dihydroxy-2-naphthoate synthase
MKLDLAFSPCPNDCFIFDAIVHERIDLEGLEFSVHLGDVEALNRAAFSGTAAVTKLSTPTAPIVTCCSMRAARWGGTAGRC